jgi:hypothetical protein
MPDYQNGKIYKITSGVLVYIGSTCEPTLARRLALHVSNYKRWKIGKSGLNTAYSLIETGQYEITLIELFPCESKDELTARERFHIEANVCVNKVIPTRTMTEWKDANKEVITKKKKIYNKKYYKKNTESIKEQTKIYHKENRDVIIEKMKLNYDTNKETILLQRKSYYEANKEEKIEKSKANYKANKEEKLEKIKKYYEANKEEKLKYAKAYREANKEALSLKRIEKYNLKKSL